MNTTGYISMWRAMSSFIATRESLTFTMTFPPIAEITVISAPVIIPRLPRNLLVSSLPPTLPITFFSPIPASVSGIISHHPTSSRPVQAHVVLAASNPLLALVYANIYV